MIVLDEKSKYCIENDCTKIASYNLVDEKKAIYCKDHLKPNMLNVKAKKCKENGCKYLPSYNYKGEKTRLYCNSH